MIAGIATNRTVVLDLSDWKYSSCSQEPWLCFFKPTSSCTLAHLKGRSQQMSSGLLQQMTSDVIDLGFRVSREYDRWTPPEIEPLLTSFHKRTQLWFVGHVSAFLMRFNSDVQKRYEAVKTELNFSHPILGIHARGDDKYQEATIHYLNEYISHSPPFSRVYLATDDQRNLDQISEFPKTEFLMLKSQGRVSGLGNRYGESAFLNLLFDIFLLSECDHFIGTDGSQISRLVYEMQQTRHVDGFAKGWSIDTIIKDKVNGFFWYLI